MIIKSVLDLDLYCISCSYAMMKNYPEAEGAWKFIDRANEKYTKEFVRDLKLELASLQGLHLSEDEYKWAKKKIPYIPQFYWQWLKGFRFNPDNFKIIFSEETGSLDIEITGNLTEIFLYDVVFLAIMSELYTKHKGHTLNINDFLKDVIDPDIELSNRKELHFSEFGTRRRFSQYLHEIVVKRLKERAIYCVGTSNVHLAMKYDMTPIGTVSHAWYQIHNSLFGYRMGNYMATEAWINAYDGNLGVALTDTTSSSVFFRNLSRKHALLTSGFRHDSGDPFKYISMFVNRYRDLGVDYRTKDLVFSNALTMQTFEEIAEGAKGRCRKVSAGIGGHLVNLPELKPNMVAKLIKCRMTSREDWVSCIKLSDDPGKAMGDPKEIEIAKLTLEL